MDTSTLFNLFLRLVNRLAPANPVTQVIRANGTEPQGGMIANPLLTGNYNQYLINLQSGTVWFYYGNPVGFNGTLPPPDLVFTAVTNPLPINVSSRSYKQVSCYRAPDSGPVVGTIELGYY